ncbi:MAG: SMC-Scp complex subunit ScpB [Nitrospirae bacterium]|nr:MAG: SMC-Scp complex subunit ScpB [Nitrospirota bacterium]
MDPQEKKALLEAILFISGEPVEVKRLQEVTGFSTGEITSLMAELMREYRDRDGGVHIVEVAEGYQMVTSPRLGQYLQRFIKEDRKVKLSEAALETLAIVAYRQPITKAEIEQIRGVSSDGVLRSLLERKLIKVVGRKAVPGRPRMYGTTKEFLQYFGLKDLSELPPMRELEPEEL